MKRLLMITSLFIFVACGSPENSGTEMEVEANDFDWLIGHWKRSNDEPGRQTFERWKRSTNILYSGFAYTTEKQDTVWQESMRLYKRGSGWTLEVSGEGEKIPFKLDKVSDSGFTSLNPEHDFPKVISYDRRADSLYALVAADEMEILFTFGQAD
ncbi:hypothetical protein FUA23_05820 [Neolewinella aurantiaca]|uniref:Lipoprotein n=1 Tax=Neolewinella aurantiaca TaxID=2602767 RepID=A0A5C7FZ96_9BACT|nr:hypothetical protein [Neolewinella aurantiaca]TXF90610.1 hypothetical protein FUA23_05820 [Neolewinella aurantiaca]